MSDSVRMLDSAALTRGLDEFRRLDPEQRSLGHRLAGEAAAHKLEELHRDVPENASPQEIQARDREERRRGRGNRGRGENAERPEEDDPAAAPPEVDEGRVLDIKV